MDMHDRVLSDLLHISGSSEVGATAKAIYYPAFQAELLVCSSSGERFKKGSDMVSTTKDVLGMPWVVPAINSNMADDEMFRPGAAMLVLPEASGAGVEKYQSGEAVVIHPKTIFIMDATDEERLHLPDTGFSVNPVFRSMHHPFKLFKAKHDDLYGVGHVILAGSSERFQRFLEDTSDISARMRQFLISLDENIITPDSMNVLRIVLHDFSDRLQTVRLMGDPEPQRK
jgi:hypothetical protein